MGFYTNDSFVPDRSIGYLIRVVNRACQAAVEPVLAAEGLTNTQWQVMVMLWSGTGETCATLARELAHDKGAMTRLIDELERRGLVARERDAGDRRLFRLTLTAKGLALTQRAKRRVTDQWNGWLDDWPAPEVEAMIVGLQRLRATIDAAAGPTQPGTQPVEQAA